MSTEERMNRELSKGLLSRTVAELMREKAEMMDRVLEMLQDHGKSIGGTQDFCPTSLPRGILSRSIFVDKEGLEIAEVVVRNPDPFGAAVTWKIEGRIL